MNALDYQTYMVLVSKTVCSTGEACSGYQHCPRGRPNCDVVKYFEGAIE